MILKICIVFCFVTNAVLTIGGCQKEESPETRLLSSLRSNPIMSTDGIVIVAAAPPVAKKVASKAIMEGIDLMALYEANRSEEPVGLGLAYLMLVSEDPRYLVYLEEHTHDVALKGELRVCRFVLPHEEARLSQEYRDRLESLLLHAGNNGGKQGQGKQRGQEPTP